MSDSYKHWHRDQHDEIEAVLDYAEEPQDEQPMDGVDWVLAAIYQIVLVVAGIGIGKAIWG